MLASGCGQSNDPPSQGDAALDTARDGDVEPPHPPNPDPNNFRLTTLSPEALANACAEVTAIKDGASDVFTQRNFCEYLAISQDDVNTVPECEEFIADECPAVIDPFKDVANRCLKEIKALDASCEAGVLDLTICIQETVEVFRSIMESTDCSDVNTEPPRSSVPPECGPIYDCDLFKFLEEYGA